MFSNIFNTSYFILVFIKKTCTFVFFYIINNYHMQPSQKKLFLLDAMALIYRAYYALNKNPRINSKGQNTSAILGFTNSLYEIIKKKSRLILRLLSILWTTLRQVDFADYKANRESTPEDIVQSLPIYVPLSKLSDSNIRVNGL